MGVGVDFGSVSLDYFGEAERRMYTALGDHVNFAARLQREANRWDDKSSRHRAPVLLSQTAWNYLMEDPPLLKNPHTANLGWPIRLEMPGLGFDYPVYEVTPDLLNLTEIQEAFKSHDKEKELPFTVNKEGKTIIKRATLEALGLTC